MARASAAPGLAWRRVCALAGQAVHVGRSAERQHGDGGGAGPAEASAEHGAAALQQHDGQDVDEQQHQRDAQQLRLQGTGGVAFIGAAIDARRQRGHGFDQALLRHQVEGTRGTGGTIVAGRVLGARLGVEDLGGRDRLRRRRRALQQAEAVQHLQGCQHVGRGGGIGILGVAGQTVHAAAQIAEAGDAAQHLNEQAGQRQVRPVRIGGDVEEHQLAVAALGGRHQRRAVLQPRPHLHVGTERGRIGQHLAVDEDVGARRQAGEQAVVGKGCKLLRLRPRHGAAERTRAEAQRRRQQLIAALLEARAGEAHQHAALLDPLRDALLDLARQRADVGQHQHGDVALDEAIDRGGQIGVLALGDLRERRQAPARCSTAAPAAAAPPRARCWPGCRPGATASAHRAG